MHESAVFFAYAVITPTSAILFIDPAKLSSEVRAHLGSEVEIKPYAEFFAYLKRLSAELQLGKDTVRPLRDGSYIWLTYICTAAGDCRRQGQLGRRGCHRTCMPTS
jgi:hypothetical protein